MIGEGLIDGIASAIKNVLLNHAGKAVVRVMAWLGIGLASHQLLIQPLVDQAVGAWNAIPPDLAAWLHLLRVDRAVSIIFSAIVIATGLKVSVMRKSQ